MALMAVHALLGGRTDTSLCQVIIYCSLVLLFTGHPPRGHLQGGVRSCGGRGREAGEDVRRRERRARFLREQVTTTDTIRDCARNRPARSAVRLEAPLAGPTLFSLPLS